VISVAVARATLIEKGSEILSWAEKPTTDICVADPGISKRNDARDPVINKLIIGILFVVSQELLLQNYSSTRTWPISCTLP
jgi:hypothetical protein